MATILLVEDNDILGELLVFQLNRAGFEVKQVDKLERAHQQLTDTHLILLDWLLPDGEGISLLPIAKRLKIPVIMLTAKASQFDRDLALEAGAKAFISKPYAFEDLEACIRSFL